MTIPESEFAQALDQLRHDGNGSWSIEVKCAYGGTPRLDCEKVNRSCG